ncbi:hypothetical protein GUITHDRAFT_151947 [Guillardia theta CCMP2712]|uniref:glucose-6-phosphate 1-epimerase n=1 Tax=Guillardia theta (strain CCMP2712) TaxID=905079 RepID=L1JGU9_GUITC|nr:hypothetical protein GUITHDRAFT_151947 [Guillardia theta CCMP2712]EKX47731.1 hypothetical protein GUITHDRAFT_151947 [Guillardia theta CCMP2712]|eukprot:XP_005834711.1 hypothetical protein GUITHDRAFT_151947 [Guillardia theta CCMP2712]
MSSSPLLSSSSLSSSLLSSSSSFLSPSTRTTSPAHRVLAQRGRADQSWIRRRKATGIVASFVPDKEFLKKQESAQADAMILRDPVKLTNTITKEEVSIYKNGACVTSYKTPDYDVFFVRPDAVLDGSKPISGGVPICFPQFGPGEIQQHGFARNMKWVCVDVREENAAGSRSLSWLREGSRAIYELVPNNETRKMWPNSFNCRYQIDLNSGNLNLELRVQNKGKKAFSFTGALHTYFAVDDIDKIAIQGGFKGKKYLDKTLSPPAEKTETEDELRISSFTERIYSDCTDDIRLKDGDKEVVIRSSQGWKDIAIWNPYGEEKMGYKNFVCIEHGVICEPVVLNPGDVWVSSVDILPYFNGLPAWMQSMDS